MKYRLLLVYISLCFAQNSEYPDSGYYLKNLSCNCYVGEASGVLSPASLQEALKLKDIAHVEDGLNRVVRLVDQNHRAVDFRKSRKVRLLKQGDTETQNADIVELQDRRIEIRNRKKCLRYSRTRNAFELGSCSFKEATSLFQKVTQRELDKELGKAYPDETLKEQMAREKRALAEMLKNDMGGNFYSWRRLPMKTPPRLEIVRHQHTHTYGEKGKNSATYFFSGRHPADRDEGRPYIHDHRNDESLVKKVTDEHPSFSPTTEQASPSL